MYLVYDGVENETHFAEDEVEAKTKLKELIESSLDEGEWMDGVENSCIAKVTTAINRNAIKAPDDYRLDTGISEWYDMEIKDV